MVRVRALATIATGIASTGVGFAVAGWAAVAALTAGLVSLAAIACWVLASTPRTNRLTRIIQALHDNDTRPSLTQIEAQPKPDKTLTQ